MLRDRRESQRKPVLVRTQLQYNGTVRDVVTTDVSAHGAFVQLDNGPPIGTPVLVTLETAGQAAVQVRSSVARHENSSMRGVGLSWLEGADPFVQRCLKRPVANSDVGAQRPSGKSLVGELPTKESRAWNQSFEASRETSTTHDPFAEFADLEKGNSKEPEVAAEPVMDWSQLSEPSAPKAEVELDGLHGFKSGTPVRFRVEGKWMVGRVRSVDGNTIQISSHWSIPLEGHVIQLAGATVVAEKLRVNEAAGIVERVEAVGSAGRQGGVFTLRLIHG